MRSYNALQRSVEDKLMARSEKSAVDRRNFLKSVAAGAATLAAPAEVVSAQPGALQPSLTMPLMPPLVETDPPAGVKGRHA